MWFNDGSSDISDLAKSLIANKQNEIFISIASLWEISIKSALRKFIIANEFETVIDDVLQSDMGIIPINFTHLVKHNKLPFYHKDPFDRIIISQAILENIDIISRDNIFDNYLLDYNLSHLW